MYCGWTEEDNVFDPTEQTHQEETREDRRCNDDDETILWEHRKTEGEVYG